MTEKVSDISGAGQRCCKETGDPVHTGHIFWLLLLILCFMIHDQLYDSIMELFEVLPKNTPKKQQKATLKIRDFLS